MKTDLGNAWTAGDIAQVLGEPRKLVQATMVTMTKDTEVVKDPARGYRIQTAKAA